MKQNTLTGQWSRKIKLLHENIRKYVALLSQKYIGIGVGNSLRCIFARFSTIRLSIVSINVFLSSQKLNLIDNCESKLVILLLLFSKTIIVMIVLFYWHVNVSINVCVCVTSNCRWNCSHYKLKWKKISCSYIYWQSKRKWSDNKIETLIIF